MRCLRSPAENVLASWHTYSSFQFKVDHRSRKSIHRVATMEERMQLHATRCLHTAGEQSKRNALRRVVCAMDSGSRGTLRAI